MSADPTKVGLERGLPLVLALGIVGFGSPVVPASRSGARLYSWVGRLRLRVRT